MSRSDEPVEKDGGQRGRPGRRCLQGRQSAVLEILQGKATVDQVARRLGDRAETGVGWRDAALAGMEAALQRRDGPTARERDLEEENDTLRDALTRSLMQVEPLQRPVFGNGGASPPGAVLRAAGAWPLVAR